MSSRIIVLSFCLVSLILFVLLFHFSRDRNSLDSVNTTCAEQYNHEMSENEIAELFSLPLVKMSFVPNTMQDKPQVRLAIDYPLETPICGLEIAYFSRHDNSIQISIKVFEASGLPTNWSCINLDEGSSNGLGYFKSVCSRTQEINEENVFLRVYSQEAKNITLQFANSLE